MVVLKSISTCPSETARHALAFGAKIAHCGSRLFRSLAAAGSRISQPWTFFSDSLDWAKLE